MDIIKFHLLCLLLNIRYSLKMLSSWVHFHGQTCHVPDVMNR
jgi:hypothetical protein